MTCQILSFFTNNFTQFKISIIYRIITNRLKLLRIKGQMRHAAKTGKTFHLWWHPHNVGVRTEYHLAQLEEIFSYYDTLRAQYGMRSLNMREAAGEVLSEETPHS